MRKRDWVLHKYHKTKDRELWNVFKRMRNLVTMNMRRAKRGYYAAVCNDIKKPYGKASQGTYPSHHD